ncbi:MAG: ACGX-repeat peptide [Lachnospiraceae bacterium]|nr:MAG: ACGX-repeat peptide [Lachnospiraceae bacterium]
MSLKNLFGWNEKEVKAQSACGTACGASDNKTEAPAACGAADKPSACGTACGASDK